MELRVFVEPQQGSDYTQLLGVATAAEQLGYDGFFVSDHYLAMGGAPGLPGPTDAWTTLAGLARETERLRLGTLVSSVTYRRPGILAVQVAQVDQMSGGRVELGLGTGWYAAEHAAYGIPFPDKRFGILEEQLAVITGLWSTKPGATFSFHGEHYDIVDSPALPKPVQTRVPVIVGGAGTTRTPALAARFAAEFNAAFPQPAEVAERFGRVRAACEQAGRDPDELVYSVAMTIAAGATDAEVQRRAAAIGRDAATMRTSALGGTAAELVDRLGFLASCGASRVYLQLLDLRDLDQLDFIAREVAPQVRDA